MSRQLRLLVSNNTGFPAELSPLSEPASHPDAIRAAAQAQVRAGVDILVPGIGVHPNPAAAIVRGLTGLRPGGNHRHVEGWGDVTAPILEASLRWTHSIFGPDVDILREVAPLPIKVSLAGPYTLASLIEDPEAICDSFGARIEACAQAIAAEIRSLGAKGVETIQLEEPLICEHSSDFPRLREALIAIARAKGSAKLGLVLWGDAICPLYDWLQTLPVDMLALDLIHSPGLASMIGDRQTSRTLALGVVDPATFAPDSPDAIHQMVRVAMEGVSADALHLQPAGTLAGLSPELAERKLACIVSAARTFAG